MESATAAGCFYRAIPFAWYFSNSSNAFTHRSPPAYFSLTDGILCDPLPKRVDDVCANAQKLACWRNQPRAFAWAARNARNRAARATQVQNAPASLANTPEACARVSSQALKSGFGCGGAGMGLPLLLFARRGTAEFELCLQFRNLFAKRSQLVL